MVSCLLYRDANTSISSLEALHQLLVSTTAEMAVWLTTPLPTPQVTADYWTDGSASDSASDTHSLGDVRFWNYNKMCCVALFRAPSHSIVSYCMITKERALSIWLDALCFKPWFWLLNQGAVPYVCTCHIGKTSHLTAFGAWDSNSHLLVIPVEVMRPGIGWDVCCAVVDF